MVDNDRLAFRVYSEADGRVYLLYEPQNCRVEVETPVTEQSLEMAGHILVDLSYKKLKDAPCAVDDETEANANPQQRANRQINAVVAPPPRGLAARLGESLFEAFALVVAIALASVLIYKLVQWSQEHLPEKLHLLVLVVCALILALSILLIAFPERLSDKDFRFWFGKNGLPFLASLNLVGASSVFASLTLWLYNHQWLTLEPCKNRPVAADSLMDFYVSQLLKLVPLLKLNETLNWNEQLCYTQARVGVLVLLFQALVVLPCIKAIRYYWQNRQLAAVKPYKYIYEPGWQPESNLEP